MYWDSNNPLYSIRKWCLGVLVPNFERTEYKYRMWEIYSTINDCKREIIAKREVVPVGK